MHVRNIGRRAIYENSSTCPGHISPRLLQCCAIRSTRVGNQQNAATAEYMCTNDYETRCRDHIIPMLIKLHWLPVCRRIEYKILSHTYRAIHRQAPQYLCDVLSLYQTARALRSQSTFTLTVPRSRTKMYSDQTLPDVLY